MAFTGAFAAFAHLDPEDGDDQAVYTGVGLPKGDGGKGSKGFMSSPKGTGKGTGTGHGIGRFGLGGSYVQGTGLGFEPCDIHLVPGAPAMNIYAAPMAVDQSTSAVTSGSGFKKEAEVIGGTAAVTSGSGFKKEAEAAEVIGGTAAVTSGSSSGFKKEAAAVTSGSKLKEPIDGTGGTGAEEELFSDPDI